jgi:hypothetical protein
MLTIFLIAEEKNYKFMSSDAMEESFHEAMDDDGENIYDDI